MVNFANQYDKLQKSEVRKDRNQRRLNPREGPGEKPSQRSRGKDSGSSQVLGILETCRAEIVVNLGLNMLN